MFSAILFDLDGLLIDSEAVFHRVEHELLVEVGVAPALATSIMAELLGRDEPTGRAIMEARLPDIDLGALDGERARRIKAASAQGFPIRPRVHDLLDALDHLGLPRAVATNSSNARAQQKLHSSGLRARVHAVIGHDDVSAPKPAPDVYLAAAEALGMSARDCLAFEDSEPGAEAARAAGCTVVQVPNLAPTQGRHAHHVAETVWDGAVMAGLRLPVVSEDS